MKPPLLFESRHGVAPGYFTVRKVLLVCPVCGKQRDPDPNRRALSTDTKQVSEYD